MASYSKLKNKMRQSILSFSLLTLVSSGAFAEGELLEKNDIQSIEALIKNLGDADFKTRAKAHQALWTIGSEALPQLKEVLKSRSPEVRYRATELYELIIMDVTAGSDPLVIEQVRRIRKFQSRDEVEQGASELMKLKVFKPLIHLYGMSPEGEMKKVLRAHVNSVFPSIATELFLKGEYEKAEFLAKKLSDLEIGSKVLVSLYAFQNRLEKEADLLIEADQEESLLMLHIRGKQGRWAEVKKISESKKIAGLSEKVALLLGDPEPLIKLYKKYKTYGGIRKGNMVEQFLLSKDLSYQISDAVDQGDFKLADSISEKLKTMFYSTADTHSLLLKNTGLLTNGKKATFERDMFNLYLGTSNEEPLFEQLVGNYAYSSEAPLALLRAIGAPKDISKLASWGTEKMKKTSKGTFANLSESEYRKLRHLLKLLSRRGEKQMVRDILEPLFDDFKGSFIAGDNKKTVRGLNEWVLELSDHGMGWYLAEKLPGFSPEVLQHLWNGLPHSEEVKVVTKLIVGEDGQLEGEQIKKMLLLSGYYNTKDSVNIEEIKAEAEEKINQQPKESHEEYWRAMFYLASMRGDVIQAKEICEKYATGGFLDEMTQVLINIRVGTGEWQQVDTMMSKFDKDEVSKYIYYVKWAGALYHLGKVSEAEEKLELFNLFAMGDTVLLKAAAVELDSLQMFEYSKPYYEQLLVLFDMSSSNYGRLIEELNFNYEIYFSKANWKMAHAIAKLNKYTNIFHVGLKSGEQGFLPSKSLSISNQADLTKGLLLFKTDPDKANTYFTRAAETSGGGGSLADFFFPSLDKIGAKKAHKAAFLTLEKEFEASLKIFPKCSHVLNSYAWSAAKAGYALEKAEANSRKSLTEEPYNSAYLDTLAEVFFARGDREKALEGSRNAVECTLLGYGDGWSSLELSLINYGLLMRQLEHFKNDPLPKRN